MTLFRSCRARMLWWAVFFATNLVGLGPIHSQSVDPLVLSDGSSLQASEEVASQLGDRFELPTVGVLRSASVAAVDQLDALIAWNQSGRLPTRNGFVRPLPLSAKVSLDPNEWKNLGEQRPASYAGGLLARLDDDRIAWTTRVEVAEAHRLRLHLEDVSLPVGARLWIYNERETVGPFGLELIGPDGDLWTPSIEGSAANLELVLPTGIFVEPARLEIAEVLQLFELAADGSPRPVPAPGSQPNTNCLIDGTCIRPSSLGIIDLYRRAVGQLNFVQGGSSFICSGGLLNDTDDSSFIPYLLTANHCFDSQRVAATLEVFFDFHTAACGGRFPSKVGLPRANGSTLLATGAASDYTLVRLSNLPPNRVFLGWNANRQAVSNGTVTYRLSHPLGFPQAYSRTRIRTSSGPTCNGLPRTHFLYAQTLEGGTLGGSSGAPVILAQGHTVGQLLGACGPDPAEGCDRRNAEVDGLFAASFPALRPFLDPQTGSSGPCVPDSRTLCLSGGRFEVRVDWNAPNGDGGSAQSVRLTPDTGYFWFFNDANVEMVIKVLNACSFANRIWVFAGGLTNVRTVISVRDTERGGTRTYVNPQNTPFQPIQDVQAFATCP